MQAAQHACSRKSKVESRKRMKAVNSKSERLNPKQIQKEKLKIQKRTIKRKPWIGPAATDQPISS
jgi:hypothetical protein